jgi:hypothetical protein
VVSQMCEKHQVWGLLLALAVAVVRHPTACGQDQPPKSNARERPDAEQILLFFCDYGYFVDRGVARSRFADSYGRENSAHAEMPDHSSPAHSSEDKKPLAIESTALERADDVLTLLNSEGLMALAEPSVASSLNLNKTTVARVKELKREFAERARILHGTLFTLTNREIGSVPRLKHELRNLSVALDRRILDCLSVQEKTNAAELVVKLAKSVDASDDQSASLSELARLYQSDTREE